MSLSIGELFVSLGFDVDDGRLKSFNEGIKTASGELLKLSAIATGGVYALNAFLEGSINRAFGIKNFSTETGQATEGLQRFQSVVNQVNAAVSTTEAAAKYRALANAMTDISQQGGGGSLARLTGGAFHIGMKEEDVIEAIRDYKQKFIAENGGGQIGVAAHARLLEQVGLGASSERAFDMSKGEYFSRSDAFVRSQGTTDSTVELGNKIAVLQQKWDKFKDDLIGEWAEPLGVALSKIGEWLKDFVLSIKAVANEWEKLPESLKVVSGIILGILALWAAPFGATLAVVSAIAVAIWDIGRAIRGLPSVTGTVLDVEKKGLKTLWNDPKKFFSNIGDAVSQHGGSDFMDYLKRDSEKHSLLNFFKSSESKKPEPEYLMKGGVVQNNTYNIQSAEPFDNILARLKRQQQQDINATDMALIGRPAY